MHEESGKTVVGVAVISAGWMGRLHANAYFDAVRKYPELNLAIDPIAVVDTVEENARAVQEKYGFRRTTASYEEVLADPEVDVVSICSPNFLHKKFALAAVAAGKPFWIEKPMGAGPEESRDIARAVADAGITTAVGFGYRHAPAVEYAREVIRSGRLGAIRNIHLRLNADYSADPDSPRTWRFERAKAGTGVLGDLLSHGTDLAQYLLGPITSVTAATETFITTRPAPTEGIGNFVGSDLSHQLPVENEDYAALLVRFASGAVGTLESSRIAIGARCDYGFELFGEKGAISWDFERMNEIGICLKTPDTPYGFTRVMTEGGFGEFLRFQPGAGLGLSFDDLKTIEAMQFLRSVTTGQQVAPNVADGYVAAAIVGAAERAATEGNWQQVPAPIGTPTFDAA